MNKEPWASFDAWPGDPGSLLVVHTDEGLWVHQSPEILDISEGQKTFCSGTFHHRPVPGGADRMTSIHREQDLPCLKLLTERLYLY